jgi:hypothetical protein
MTNETAGYILAEVFRLADMRAQAMFMQSIQPDQDIYAMQACEAEYAAFKKELTYRLNQPAIFNKSNTFEDAVNGLVYYDPAVNGLVYYDPAFIKDIKIPETTGLGAYWNGIGKAYPGPAQWQEDSEKKKLEMEKQKVAQWIQAQIEIVEAVKLATKKAEEAEAEKQAPVWVDPGTEDREV